MRPSLRRLLALVSVLGAAGLALPGAAQAATTSFSGTLLVHLPKKASEPFPCSGGEELCAAGTLRGLGAVHLTLGGEEDEEIEGTGCFIARRFETVTVLDGSGTIALESSGVVCGPGRSLASHASETSPGKPFKFDMTFTVNGEESTGAYHEASGSGIESAQFAGATGVWRLQGTITTG